MQLSENCTRTCSPSPPLGSLFPLSLPPCLAGFSPGQARSRSGPVGTSYSTIWATFCWNVWAWTSWAWTCTTGAVSSRKSTSMSGWVFRRTRRVNIAAPQWPWCVFVELVHHGVFRNFASSTTTSGVMLWDVSSVNDTLTGIITSPRS